MDAQKLTRIAIAAQVAGVNRSTLKSAVERGDLPSYLTACGLPLVVQADVNKWAKQERQRGPKPANAGE